MKRIIITILAILTIGLISYTVISTNLMNLNHTDKLEPWKTIENVEGRFSIAYPPHWTATNFSETLTGVRPPDMDENSVEWAVMVSEDTTGTLAPFLRDMGSQFSARSISEKELALNGRKVYHLVATTPEKVNWRHEKVIVRNFGKVFVIMNSGKTNSNFELFWRSFQFLNQPNNAKENKTKKFDNQK
jgi:hypothetical protein